MRSAPDIRTFENADALARDAAEWNVGNEGGVRIAVDVGLLGILFSIAGFLAVKVIRQGEQLAGLLAHKEDTKERFDRQDGMLESLDRKLDAIMNRFNVRPSPPPPGG